jgi:hypothetical protein
MKNLKKFYEKEELTEWEEEMNGEWRTKKKKKGPRGKEYQQDRWLFGFPPHYFPNRKRKQ